MVKGKKECEDDKNVETQLAVRLFVYMFCFANLILCYLSQTISLFCKLCNCSF